MPVTADKVITQGDYGRPFTATLTESGSAADLSSYSGVTMTMTPYGSTKKIVDAEAVTIDGDGTSGGITRTWVSPEIDIPGYYEIELRGTVGGSPVSFPTAEDPDSWYLILFIKPKK